MANRKQVEELRKSMDAADVEILRMLEQRAKLAREIAALHRDQPPVPAIPERQRLDRLQELATGDLPVESVRMVFKVVHAACASLEGPTRVAYVGAEGGFGHAAARQMFGVGVEAMPAESPGQAFDELARGRVDFALALYETSHEGPVLSTVLALKQTDLVVTGLCEMTAALSLMSRTGNLADIEKVYASAYDRAQCQALIAEKLPRASIVDVRSPSIACQSAGEDNGAAAIAHDEIGELHGLQMVIPNIADQHELRMRYAIVGTRPSPRSGKDITSMVFTLRDEPGALLAVLGDFAKRGVNVKNIMSRPVLGEMWDYIFYIDVVGHATDRALVAALDDIRKHTRFFKLIGSYPTHC
ncbi:MAG: ACT domain-containing protein [Polyangiaceae bacterium]|jgi:chorismate mutase/prephenate dehydratase|nr:ACT domain-containing protein [Polyangiaceae bacterium]